jgi:hypothetical protein
MDFSNRSQALLTRYKTRLEAKRKLLSQVLSQRPANSAREARRQRFVQRALNVVESRHQRASAYKEHLQALQEVLSAAAGTDAIPGSSAGEKSARRDYGDI